MGGTAVGASETRTRLAMAAAHLFARHGIEEVPLRDVAALAGQRNASAVQYHFDGRWDLVAAVLALHADTVRGWAPPLDEMTGDDIVTGLVALLRPELARPEGRDFLRINFQLISRYPARWDQEPDVVTGFDDLVTRLVALLDPLPADVARVRAVSMAQFVCYQFAERSRLVDDPGPVLLDEDTFIANLVAMAGAMLTARWPR